MCDTGLIKTQFTDNGSAPYCHQQTVTTDFATILHHHHFDGLLLRYSSDNTVNNIDPIHQQLFLDTLRYVTVKAREYVIGKLDQRNATSQPRIGLGHLHAHRACAHDQQVFRQCFQAIHIFVGQIADLVQTFDVRYPCA